MPERGLPSVVSAAPASRAHAVIRNKDVGESIVIVVREAHAKRAPLDRRNPGTLADVFECAITTVAIKNICGDWELSRRAVGLPLAAADLAVLRIPYHVARA